jgi:uncharacterized protein (DUF58 family)
VAITSAIAVVAGPPIFISLGFSLAAVAAGSLVLVSSARVAGASLEPDKVRAFKHEKASAKLKLAGIGSKLVGSREFSVQTPWGVKCALGEFRGGSGDLTLEASRAGRFEKLSLRLTDTDLLGLFAREEVVPLEGFVLESLPLSLRARTSPVSALAVSVGDSPAGKRGGGQELYAVEQYHPELGARDVIWSRVARSPVEELVSGTREASIKRFVSIAIALTWKSEEHRAVILDTSAEAVAQIGKTLLEFGTALRLSYLAKGKEASAAASSLPELADLTMELSSIDNCGIKAHESITGSDLFIAEINDYRDGAGSFARRGEPVLLISETTGFSDKRNRLFIFTGREDLSALIASVIET